MRKLEIFSFLHCNNPMYGKFKQVNVLVPLMELLAFCLQQKPVESSGIGKHFVRAPAPSTVTNSHQGPIQAKLAIVPDPHRFFLSLEKLYGTRYQAPILHVKNSLRCQRSCLDRQIYGSLKSSCLLDLAVRLI